MIGFSAAAAESKRFAAYDRNTAGPINYRADIDGLRAVAILAVIAYHLWPTLVPSGYLGVDVFFVVSGFLITAIIQRTIHTSRFSFTEFLARRARRLLPALIVVLLVVWAFSFLFAFLDEFRSAGRDIASAAGFLANINFYHADNDYFGPRMETNPVVHLWSLGVEEQFYLVWPPLLFAITRFRCSAIATVLACVLSWLGMLVALRADPVGSFFLPQYRAWELLAGALIAQTPPLSTDLPPLPGGVLRTTSIVALSSLVLIFFVKNGSDDRWLFTTAVVLLTGTLIWTGELVSSPVLRSRPIVAIGLLSYPLYLWHWPIIAFARLFQPNLSFSALLLIAVSAFALSAATYKLFELPLRGLDARTVALPLLATMIVVGSLGMASRVGLVQPRSHNAGEVMDIPESSRYEPAFDRSELSATQAAGTRRIVLFGDSHMLQYWPRAKVLAPRLAATNTQLVLFTGGCPAYPYIERLGRRRRCADDFAHVVKYVMNHKVEILVLSSFWEGYFLPPFDNPQVPNNRILIDSRDPAARPLTTQSLANSVVLRDFRTQLQLLAEMGTRIVFVESNPTSADFDPKRSYSRTSWKRRTQPPISRDAYEAYEAPVLAQLKGALPLSASVIKSTDFLCTRELCPTTTDRGELLYRDDNHIRATVARRLALIDSIAWGSETFFSIHSRIKRAAGEPPDAFPHELPVQNRRTRE